MECTIVSRCSTINVAYQQYCTQHMFPIATEEIHFQVNRFKLKHFAELTDTKGKFELITCAITNKLPTLFSYHRGNNNRRNF